MMILFSFRPRVLQSLVTAIFRDISFNILEFKMLAIFNTCARMIIFFREFNIPVNLVIFPYFPKIPLVCFRHGEYMASLFSLKARI